MTSTAACAMAKMQYRLRLAAVEAAKFCLVFVEMYEAVLSKKAALMGAIAGLRVRPSGVRMTRRQGLRDA